MLIRKIPVVIFFMLAVFLLKEEPQEYFDFEKYDLSSEFRHIIPEVYSVEEANYPSKWSEIYGSDEETVAKYILTSPYCDDIKGYGGNLKLAIVADKDEIITGVVILSHRETPSWVSGLKNINFFDSWNGKKIHEIKDHAVDAVSGATYTSDAVRKIINMRSGIFTGDNEYIITSAESEFKWFDQRYSVVLYFILLISITGLFVKKLNKYRIYIQILSIIFFGIISGEFISLYFLETLSINGTGIFTTWTTVLLLSLSVLIPLVFSKHFYCYYICPFGGVQTILGKIPVKKLKVKPELIKFMRILRLLIFISLFILILASLQINLTLIEPFSLFIFSSAASVTIISSIIIFAVSIFVKNPWCVYLCPTGQFFDLLKNGLPLKKTN